GSPLMNCDLCKYRVRLVGREADLGLPQEGHHHHARAGDDPSEDHAHGPRARRRVRNAQPEAAGVDPSFHVWDRRLLDRLQLSPCGPPTLMDSRRPPETGRGQVSILGVGPGDPELLTLRGLNALKGCDLVVHPGPSDRQGFAFEVVRTFLRADQTVLGAALAM